MDPTTMFAFMMGGGMLANAGGQVAQAGFGYLSSNAWATANQNIAARDATAQENITTTNANAMTSMATTNANAGVEQTRWQVMGMIQVANRQYMQAMDQMQFADKADRRQSMTQRMQLNNEMRMMTLAYNAQIHADDLSHQERLTEMQYGYAEKLAEIRGPSSITFDPSSLLS